MFRIAVCDDQPEICQQVAEWVGDFAVEKNCEIEVNVYLDEGDLLKRLGCEPKIDLLFLDIELSEMNGVEIGKTIRRQWNDQIMQIVYISAREQYAMELFQIRPMHFLIKPLERRLLLDQVQLAMELAKDQNGSFFQFQIDKAIEKIPYGEILYFESQRKKIRIVTSQGDTECYGKLNEVESNAPAMNFVRIHKSYLVNDLYVRSWRGDSVTLQNGQELPITRTYRAMVKRKIMAMQGRRGKV